MIELKAAGKVYNAGQSNQITALHPLDLNITSGEFVTLVGVNGSGKSTLLNLIAGSIYPSTGRVFIEGNDVTAMPDYQRSKWIARVFQNPLTGTAAELSILENFKIASLRTQGKFLQVGTTTMFRKTVQERIATLGMGLEDKIMQPMGSLSGGQRQALTLLMTVMNDCRILLLDEPSAALDPRSAEVVMRLANSLITQYQLTAILITHNLKEAFTYGNRIIHLHDGEISKDMRQHEKSNLTQNDLFYWFG